jgi:uncharacterized membrane protein
LSQEQKPSIPRPRIEGLSDLIFGLALSIGAISLLTKVPSGVNDIITAIGAFGFSFLILLNVWNRYTTLTSVIPVETQAMIRLNMLLLFLVALEPYLFNLLVIDNLGSPSSGMTGAYASSFFAIDIGAMNFVMAYFTHLLTIEKKRLIPSELIQRFKISRNGIIAAAAIFMFSALPIPILWDPNLTLGGLPLRIILWVASVPFIWVTRITMSHKTPKQVS